MSATASDMRERYLAAPTFEQFLETAAANRDLWHGTYRRAAVAPEVVARAVAAGGEWHLLVLNEDWCGDAVNTVPYVARLAELAPNLELRALGRDVNLDLMDAHLTNGARAIPVVIAYDAAFSERGWWGPRPAELQNWVQTEGKALEKPERYREVRRWYARDRGRTTLAEIIRLLEGLEGSGSEGRGPAKDG